MAYPWVSRDPGRMVATLAARRPMQPPTPLAPVCLPWVLCNWRASHTALNPAPSQVAYCAPFMGGMSQANCGKCMRMTSTSTGSQVIVRIVDMCGHGSECAMAAVGALGSTSARVLHYHIRRSKAGGGGAAGTKVADYVAAHPPTIPTPNDQTTIPADPHCATLLSRRSGGQ